MSRRTRRAISTARVWLAITWLVVWVMGVVLFSLIVSELMPISPWRTVVSLAIGTVWAIWWQSRAKLSMNKLAEIEAEREVAPSPMRPSQGGGRPPKGTTAQD